MNATQAAKKAGVPVPLPAPTIRYLPQPYTILDRPLWWHEQGLTQTASGYGRKLTSARCVQLPDGRVRRVYVTCFSNAGSAWITLNGEKLWLGGS